MQKNIFEGFARHGVPGPGDLDAGGENREFLRLPSRTDYKTFNNTRTTKTMSYIDKLIASCHQAKAAQPIQTLVITKGTDLAALERIQKAIYVIEEINGNQDETYQALALYKGKEERACPKLNKASDVMYVG